MPDAETQTDEIVPIYYCIECDIMTVSRPNTKCDNCATVVVIPIKEDER